MSERDVLKRFWLQIASGIILLVIAGIATSTYVAKSTTERSLRNEVAVKELRDIKADKGYDNGIHQTLLNGQISNSKRIAEQDVKTDNQFQFLIERLDVVNSNILELHK